MAPGLTQRPLGLGVDDSEHKQPAGLLPLSQGWTPAANKLGRRLGTKQFKRQISARKRPAERSTR